MKIDPTNMWIEHNHFTVIEEDGDNKIYELGSFRNRGCPKIAQ
jgi:hypothetical protein